MPSENDRTDIRARTRAGLLRRREELQTTLFELDQRIEELADEDAPTELQSTSVRVAQSRRGKPLRAALLDALEDLDLMAYSRELVLYLKARYGRNVPSTRFGSLG